MANNLPENAPKLPRNVIPFVWYFVRMHWWVFALMLILEAGQATFMLLLPYAAKGLIDTVAFSSETNLWENLKTPIWAFILFNISMIICARSSGALLISVGPKLRANIRKVLFTYMQFHSQRYFSSKFAGALANRVNEVSVSVMHGIWLVVLDLWPVLITFGVALALLAAENVDLAIFLGGWMTVYLIIAFILASYARRLAREFAATRSMVSGKVVDAVTNMMNIKMFSRRHHENEYIETALQQEVKHAKRLFWYMELMRWFQFLSSFALMVGLMLMAVQDLASGQLTAGGFAMVFSLSLLVINGVRGISRVFLNFFEYFGNISDGVGVIVQPHDVLDKPQAQPLKVTNGEVIFDSVHFEYDADKPVLSEFNLKINAGEKVGLVGVSGAGKSTLTALLLRLYDIQSGCIAIDGQNISDVTQDSLREQIATIPQEPMLFHRSLMENIRYGKITATDKEVIEAAKKAFCHEFIMETTEGYKTLVGERGVKLSGGQRQRIAIARALLKDAPILLLDEATSSLDTHSEKYIQKSLDILMKNRTVLVVAHRLSTIAHLDRIIVLENGQIVEDGNPKKLMKNKNSYFGKLWALQADGFLPEDIDKHAQSY